VAPSSSGAEHVTEKLNLPGKNDHRGESPRGFHMVYAALKGRTSTVIHTTTSLSAACQTVPFPNLVPEAGVTPTHKW
jgi:hypothetical protein